ncbi:nucleoporin-interacting protein [Fictibacillus iocasae]|uniref:Nucleoporin-interacting protein n=1 Tax=Fictibacillus iocasae TaxID=2715437 RepID=A0ABW2NQR5_9BACL
MPKNHEKERVKRGRRYFLGNNVELFSLWSALVGFAMLSVIRLRWAADMPATWDEVDFVLAVDQFSLADMQPHFPGYPYFILGGMLLSFITHSDTFALILWNHLILFSAVFPLYWLSKIWVSSLSGRLLAVGSVQLSSYVCIISSQPVSEGAALGVMWWYIWSLYWALKKTSLLKQALPFFLFSLLMGIRLSYLPLGIGLLLFMIWKHRDVYHTSILFISACIFQWIWISALVMSEGGIFTFLHLALSFTEGHFTEWGGAITADQASAAGRFFRFIRNIGYSAAAGENWLLLLFFLGLCVYSLRKSQLRRLSKEEWMYAVMLLSYLVYAYTAQNTEKARHVLPVSSMILFAVFSCLGGIKKKGKMVLFLFLILQTVNGFYLLQQARSENPAVYQMEEYIASKRERAVLYTWEETRVLQYSKAPFRHKRIETYAFFQEEIKQDEKAKVYVTGKALAGFKSQNASAENCARNIKNFSSSHLVDPVYHSITLYEWTCR